MLYDDVSGLYYARARWYDPYIGRFLSEDPIGLGGGINQYAFAGGDPINGSDPSGLAQTDFPTCVTFSNGISACSDWSGILSGVTVTGRAGSGPDYSFGFGDPGARGQGFFRGGGYDDEGQRRASGGSVVQQPKPTDHQIACANAIAVAAISVALDYTGASELRAAARFGTLAVRVGAEYGIRSFSRSFASSAGAGISKTAFEQLAPALGAAVQGYGAATIYHGANAYSSVAGTVAGQLVSGDFSLWDYVPVVASIRSINNAIHTCR